MKRKFLLTAVALLCAVGMWATDYTSSLPAQGSNWSIAAGSGGSYNANVDNQDSKDARGQIELKTWKVNEVYSASASELTFDAYTTVSVAAGTYLFRIGAWGRKQNVWGSDNGKTDENNVVVYASGDSEVTTSVTSATGQYYHVVVSMASAGTLRVGIKALSGNKANWVCWANPALITLQPNENFTTLITNPNITDVSNRNDAPTGWVRYKNDHGGDECYTAATGDTKLQLWATTNNKEFWGDIYQTINSLPEGYYALTALVSDRDNDGANLYIYRNSTTEKKTVTITTSTEQDKTTPLIYIGNNESLNIGFEAINTNKCFITADNFRLTYYGKNADKPINWTSLITNPDFSATTWSTGWTGTGNNKATAFADQPSNANFTGHFAEMWVKSGADMSAADINQTLNSLPAGIYTLSAKMQAGIDCQLYAGNQSITYNGGVATKSFFFSVPAASNVKIGYKHNGVTGASGDTWVAVDDFALTYKGANLGEAAETFTSPSAVSVGTWYKFTTGNSNDVYILSSDGDATITYTTDGTVTDLTSIATTWTLTAKQNILLAPSTTYYIKSSAAVTLEKIESSVESSYVSGWTKVTSLETLRTNPENYFYAIFSANNPALILDASSSNGSSKLYYKTAADPLSSSAYLFELENYGENGGFALKSASWDKYFANRSGAAWDYMATKSTVDGDCEITMTLSNGVYTLQDKYTHNGNHYLGLWTPSNGYVNNQDLAGNKSDAEKGSFLIYRIAKDGLNMTSLITNPSFEDSDVSCWTFDHVTNGNHREANGSDGSYHGTFWKQDYNSASDSAPGLHQSVTLPAGYYRLEFDAYNNNGSTHTWKEVQLYFGATESDKQAYNTSYNSYRTFGFEFEVATTTTANLGVTFTPTGNGNIWEYFDNFRLTYLGTASIKPSLLAEITTANGIYNSGANVGDGAFQIPSADGSTFSSAISTAQGVYDNASATVSAVFTAIENLKAAEETYAGATLNAPTSGVQYRIKSTAADAAGWKNLYYVLKKGGNDDQGGYSIRAEGSDAAYLATAWQFTSVSGNDYKMSMTDADGATRYICTALGGYDSGNTTQIRTTTDASKALVVKVIAATGTAGRWYLQNKEDDSYIGGQDAGFYSNSQNYDLALEAAEKASVPVTISAGKYATRIFPFKPTLPSGVTAHSCAANVGSTLTLGDVADPVANVPYILLNNSGADVDENLVGWGTAKQDTYNVGYLTGFYTAQTITAGNYVLQTQAGKQAFYKLEEDAIANQVYRAYLTVPAGVKPAAFFFDEDQADAISDVRGQMEDGRSEIFNLAGQRVNKAQKGLYIINGKKVLVK